MSKGMFDEWLGVESQGLRCHEVTNAKRAFYAGYRRGRDKATMDFWNAHREHIFLVGGNYDDAIALRRQILNVPAAEHLMAFIAAAKKVKAAGDANGEGIGLAICELMQALDNWQKCSNKKKG